MIKKEVAYYNMSLKYQMLDDDILCLYIKTLQNMLDKEDLDINTLCNMLSTIIDNDLKEISLLHNKFNGLVAQLNNASFFSVLSICKKIQNNAKKFLEIYKRVMQIRCIQIIKNNNTNNSDYEMLGNTINEHKKKLYEVTESMRDDYSKVNEKGYDGYGKLNNQNKSKIDTAIAKIQNLFKGNTLSENLEVFSEANNVYKFIEFLFTTKAGYFALFMIFMFCKTRPVRYLAPVGYLVDKPLDWFGWEGRDFRVVDAMAEGTPKDMLKYFGNKVYTRVFYGADSNASFSDDMKSIDNTISGALFDPNADYAKPWIPILNRNNIDISNIKYASQFGSALDQLVEKGIVSKEAIQDTKNETKGMYGFHWILGIGFIISIVILIVLFIYWFISKYRAMKEEEQLENLNNKLDQINKDSAEGKSFEATTIEPNDNNDNNNEVLTKASDFTGFSNTASYKPTELQSKTNDIHGIL